MTNGTDILAGFALGIFFERFMNVFRRWADEREKTQ